MLILYLTRPLLFFHHYISKGKKNFFVFLALFSLHVVLLTDVEAVFINSTWNSKWTTSGRKLLLLNNCGFWWKKIINKIFTLVLHPSLTHSLNLNCYESNLIMTANDTSQKYFLFVCLFLPHRNIQIFIAFTFQSIIDDIKQACCIEVKGCN